MTHGRKEASLGRIGLLGGGARDLKRLFLSLSICNVAHDRNNFGLRRCCRESCLFRGLAAHFDPDESSLVPLVRSVAPEAKFNAPDLTASSGIREGGEIGRTVSHVYAVEQTVTEQ